MMCSCRWPDIRPSAHTMNSVAVITITTTVTESG